MGDIVYLRAAPPWPFGTIARAVPRAFALYTRVDPSDLSTYEGQAYLLVVTAFDAELTVDLPAPPLPFGTIDRRTARYLTSQGRSATTYPACTGNAARSTANDDVPAAQYVPGKLSPAFNYEISLFSSGDPSTKPTATLGILELIDPDGELDDLRTLGWDGATVELRRGDPEAYFSTYRTVATLSTAGLRYSLRKKEILLRDLAWQLELAELHGERYGGTGGIDGDDTLKGRIKPLALGSVFNITPVQINALMLIYQVSCSSVLAIDAVRDGGEELTLDANYATYEELAALSMSAGFYATCDALGLFRIGAEPAFIITADVRGDNDTVNGLSYPHTRAQIARRIATGRGNIRLADPSQIDATAYDYLEQFQTATLGYYWDAEITKVDALNEVMAGCAGWWTMRLDGQLAIGQLEDPATQSALFSLSYPTEEALEARLNEPEMTDYVLPRRTTLMGWSRNFTKMALTQIAGGVAQSDVAIFQADSRFATSDDLWVAAGYPSAPVVTVAGGFADEADAQREGDRQMRLFRTRREPYQIAAVIDPFADVAGRIINIANSNRLGLESSRNLFCFGVTVNGDGKPILKLWG